MLDVIHLDYAYRDKEILKDLEMHLPAGEIIGLVAPNGTGKTTLLKILARAFLPKKGQITLNSIDYSKREKYLQQLFFMESIANLSANLTAVDHLKYVKKMWDSSVSIEDVLQNLGMESYANKKVAKFSLGMKQHLIIALYIVSDTPLLLLDEPHNGLDPSSVKVIKQVFRSLKEKGKTIFYSSHDLYNMENFCDQVFFMKEKKIFLSVKGENDLDTIYEELYLPTREELSL